MDKMTFASHKFKPSDVIEGLNRYFADTKANRYLRASLTIRNGVCFNDPDCVKDIIFTTSPPDRHTRSGHVCWNYYLICDPEEVVGVAINWLREEHDIFYVPGMNEPPIKDTDDIDDFYVDDAAKQYEKVTRKDDAKHYSEKDLREALGIAEDSDIFQCIKYRNHQLETLRTELAAARRMYHDSIKERNQFGRRLMDIRKASGMADNDPTDLVEYVESLRNSKNEYEHLYKQYEKMYCELRDAKFTKLSEERDRYKWLYENLKNGMESVLQEAEERED